MRLHLQIAVVIPFLVFLLLAMCCRNLKYSSYFHMSTDDINEKIASNIKHELLVSDEYFRDRISNDFSIYYNSINELYPKDMIIMVITSNRPKGHGYLKWAMKNIDVEMRSNRDMVAGNFGILICNTNLPPKEHKLAKYMSQFFPTIDIYNDNIVKSSEGNNNASYKEEKYRRDYVTCLEAALDYKNFHRVKGILLLEDDVVPNFSSPNGIWLKQMNVVYNIMENYRSIRAPYSLVKLFEPDRY